MTFLHFRRFLFLVPLLLMFLTVAATAQDRRYAAEFDAYSLNRAETRLVQLGLGLQRDYLGLLDGKWGRNSQRGLEAYARRSGDIYPSGKHVAELTIGAVRFIEEHGIYHTYSEHLGFSYFWSTNMVEGAHSEGFLNYALKNTSVGVSVQFGDITDTAIVHNYVEGFAASPNRLYKVRKTSVLVTSGTNARGKTLYARSNFVNGVWSTLLVSAERQDEAILGAITASITRDPYADFALPEDGFLAATLAAYFRDNPQKSPETVAEDVEDGPSSGSGFFVSANGDVLTNAHVVKGCRQVHINDQLVEVAALSNNFDLALLKTKGPSPAYARFSPAPAKLNQDVTVVGYPLAGLLGGLNVTRGAVSSTTGLRGDETTMQISAPVQPGNSGGPVVDQTGTVVGVVVSKLDAALVQEAIGDIPQNINFAIRASAAKLFMSLNGVEPKLTGATATLAATEVAELAQGYSVQIHCTP